MPRLSRVLLRRVLGGLVLALLPTLAVAADRPRASVPT